MGVEEAISSSPVSVILLALILAVILIDKLPVALEKMGFKRNGNGGKKASDQFIAMAVQIGDIHKTVQQSDPLDPGRKLVWVPYKEMEALRENSEKLVELLVRQDTTSNGLQFVLRQLEITFTNHVQAQEVTNEKIDAIMAYIAKAG